MACFIENIDICGHSENQLMSKHPCIQCYPLFDLGLYDDGHIIFYKTRNDEQLLGPILRSIGDLHFLYQIPEKFTRKLAKYDLAKDVFNPKYRAHRKLLYGFSVKHNYYLREYIKKGFRYSKIKVCGRIIYIYIYILQILRNFVNI